MKIIIIKKCGSENDLYLLHDDNDFINMAMIINNSDLERRGIKRIKELKL